MDASLDDGTIERFDTELGISLLRFFPTGYFGLFFLKWPFLGER